MILFLQDSSKLDSLPVLPNVKKLRLRISGRKQNWLLDLASITNACPNLESFTFEVLGYVQLTT